MEKIKITNHQLFLLTAGCLLSGTVIIIAASVTGVAKQDAWISALLTPVFGIPVIWMFWFLGSQYPGFTFIGILRKIFGKWIGLIVSAGFVFMCLEIANHTTWYVGSFLTEQVMPETPQYVINLLFVTAYVVAALYGIEAFARTSEVLVKVAAILFFLAMILVSPNANIENLQPVLEKGIIPVLKGTVFLHCYITFPIVLMMMIYPFYISNIAEAKKSLFKGYLLTAAIIFIGTLMSILVMGSDITSKLHYPVYFLAKEINVGIIFTRLEFVVAASWLVTLFIVTFILFYDGVIGLSELLGLKDYKKIVIPLGLIESVMTTVVFPNSVYQANWDALVWTPYAITYGLLLPVLLLLVFLIKKWVFKRIKR